MKVSSHLDTMINIAYPPCLDNETFGINSLSRKKRGHPSTRRWNSSVIRQTPIASLRAGSAYGERRRARRRKERRCCRIYCFPRVFNFIHLHSTHLHFLFSAPDFPAFFCSYLFLIRCSHFFSLIRVIRLILEHPWFPSPARRRPG